MTGTTSADGIDMGIQCPHCGSKNTSLCVEVYSKFMAKYYGWQQTFSVCNDCGWAEPCCLPVADEYDGTLPNGFPDVSQLAPIRNVSTENE